MEEEVNALAECCDKYDFLFTGLFLLSFQLNLIDRDGISLHLELCALCMLEFWS